MPLLLGWPWLPETNIFLGLIITTDGPPCDRCFGPGDTKKCNNSGGWLCYWFSPHFPFSKFSKIVINRYIKESRFCVYNLVLFYCFWPEDHTSKDSYDIEDTQEARNQDQVSILGFILVVYVVLFNKTISISSHFIFCCFIFL